MKPDESITQVVASQQQMSWLDYAMLGLFLLVLISLYLMRKFTLRVVVMDVKRPAAVLTIYVIYVLALIGAILGIWLYVNP